MAFIYIYTTVEHQSEGRAWANVHNMDSRCAV